MTNILWGIEAFLRSWDAAESADDARARARRGHGNIEGESGNVNLTGRPDAPAAIVSRRHPGFEDALEDRVRKLVLALIRKLDCVTYSSCGGHPSQDGSYVAAGANIDILPRSREERGRVLETLQECLDSVYSGGRLVRVELKDGALETELGELPCLHLDFRPTAVDRPSEYFAELELLCAALTSALDARNPGAWRACSN